jgi:hypothetical protein
MAKYCCFFCPQTDYSEKSLDDRCPICDRQYGFVLQNHPTQIRGYRVTKVLGRGFYGSAYVVESGFFGRKNVIKVSPVAFYAFFGKPPFEDEVLQHARLAESAAHVVGIVDAFNEVVKFSDAAETELACYVTVLDYIDGALLKDYTSGKARATSAAVCQIAVDLLRIRSEFEDHKVNHNDLHDENLIVERLRPEARRPDAIEASIRVMAIDLGSISDESKSSEQRLGDLHFIALHVDALVDRLLSDPSALDDRDFRIALSLQSVVHGLQSAAQNVRLPGATDLIGPIREAFYHASHHWRPWNNELNLKGFADHYNAQTLESWDVPRLLVDPENKWLGEITRPGPQIITGMRGCGKTMLLRALDIHARAAQTEGEGNGEILARIRSDRFVGLFVSAQRLLDLREQSLRRVEHRLTRLFVTYSLQAVRSLLHIQDIDGSAVVHSAHTKLGSAVADYLQGGEELRHAISLEDLEHRLQRITVLTIRGDDQFSVGQAPAMVFPHLAERLLSCSELFRSSSVFFLLDDVSTRYLELDKIESLLSALLFQSSFCAFKFTSEWQTIELGLRSPGRNHPVRIDRDLTIFDLGADVLKTINAPGSKGKEFVAQILQQRARLHPAHPRQRDPKGILGDVPLEQVAREIASSNKTSSQKKRVYRGLTCLANVCVGDIGDVIKLYEEILRRAGVGDVFPIPEEVQSGCFQEISARRVYDLNRRAGYFKDHALAFAEAAHDLLVRSYRTVSKTGIAKENPRLRQYSSIYVRVTTDDETKKKQQIDRLRDLIDAGVFVFAGGAPRVKAKDSNPIQQFILSYRKIYGLAAVIGLADRDRFELSGQGLENWLERPSSAKKTLLRNQIKSEVEAATSTSAGAPSVSETNRPNDGRVGPIEPFSGVGDEELTLGPKAASPQQARLFDVNTVPNLQVAPRFMAKPIAIEIQQLSDAQLRLLEIGGVITALGFEDRALASNEFLSGSTSPQVVYAIRYPLKGNATPILEAWRQIGKAVIEIPYSEALVELPNVAGLCLVDVSGLAKPLIFRTIRRELTLKGRVLVCLAAAQDQYPLQEDVERLFAAQRSGEPVAFLENLTKVLTGEKGPYNDLKLLEEQSDPSRTRALLAFASPKHERLFNLLDRREFDHIEVVTPTGDNPRAKVAAYAAEFVSQNYPNAKVTQLDSHDLLGLVKHLDERYLELYGIGGSNLELGLTGSKIQAVAAAIIAARRKISQAWYLGPGEFDEKRFSTGVESIRVLDIRITTPVDSSAE